MNSVASMLEAPTRILFFTGKGGVGKTSLACATSVSLASGGKRVLLVSTDPASNLDEVLNVRLSGEPTAVPGADGLFALNIDPEGAARAYRERVVGPFRGVFPHSAITSMEEQLSGASTVEIAAFDEFTKLLSDGAATAGFDHIVFDTAPTGHTLRLLQLPAAWTGFIANNTTGTSCLGPLSGLGAQRASYEASVRALRDPETTTLVMVSRPDGGALNEAARSSQELSAIGMRNQRLMLNGVFAASDRTDQAACALEQRQKKAVNAMPAELAALPRTNVPLLPFAPLGVKNLARVFGGGDAQDLASVANGAVADDAPPSLGALIDELERRGRGVIMTMGKGGVGKTTIASAIAVELADRGHAVHLSTTDPAAHVNAAVAGVVRNLTVSRIDPAKETKEYSEAVLAKAAGDLDAGGLALLEEDLRSPCTEEIAVFHAFARTVAQGATGFVVLDTAPTGHTILLLDAAEAYHREVSRTMSDQPEEVRSLLPRLRDPEFTRILLITLPEATPVHEAAKLQDDLARAGIGVFAWVVNLVFSPGRFSDPLLASLGKRQNAFLSEVRDKFAARFAIVPWEPVEPIGVDGLRQLTACGAGVSG